MLHAFQLLQRDRVHEIAHASRRAIPVMSASATPGNR
jgi:hypothetical protein